VTMTTSRATILSAVLALGLPAQAQAADGWGSSWSFGPVHPTTSNHIVHTRTTIVPGRLPPITSTVGPLYLWPGLSNPTSDLIQTTMDAQSYNASYCGATATQWCVEASVFGSFGQRNGTAVAIDPDDHVTIEYVLGSDNNTWTQTVTSQKLGKVVSTLTSTSGLMYGGGFGFATEADANSYTIDTQYYLCTEIHLDAADPTFGATGVGGIGAKMGATGTGSGIGTIKNLHTPDGGLTWLADLITLPAMNPQGTQTPVPTYNCATGGAGGSGGGGAAGGSSGAGGTGARGGSGGGTGGSASGGARGSGGVGGGGHAGGTGGVAGTRGSGGVGAGGRPGGGGVAGGESGGSSGTGEAGTGGVVVGGGGAAGSTSAGNAGTSGSGQGGTNGVASGSGGAAAGGGRPGGSGSAGTSGDSSMATNGSSGCSCSMQPGARSGSGGTLLLLGFLFASLVRRRRNT
jgi:MYXO-CTERM domain-containing protein